MVEKVNMFDQISRNKRNSFLLFMIVFAITLGFVYIFAQVYNPALTFVFSVVALIVVLGHSLISYYVGDKIVLKTVGAYPADDVKHVHLINVVEGLAIAAQIPKPKIYIIPSKDINAFATGRDPDHASIAVTEGALEKLNREELEGVVAHEISHIANYDIRYGMLVAVLVGLVAILSEIFLRSMWFSSRDRDREGGNVLFLLIGIVLAVVAPIIVRIVQLSISRQREFLADATGAKLTRYPQGLANALKKIKMYNQGIEVSEAESHLFIDDPKKSFADNLFATHPPIEERIKRLESM